MWQQRQHKGNKKTGTVTICYLCYLCYLCNTLRICAHISIHTILYYLNNIHVLFPIRSVFSKIRGNKGNTIKNHTRTVTVYVTLM